MNTNIYPTTCPNCMNDLTKGMLLRRYIPATNFSQGGFLNEDGSICDSLQQPPKAVFSSGNVYCTNCNHIVWDVSKKPILDDKGRVKGSSCG